MDDADDGLPDVDQSRYETYVSRVRDLPEESVAPAFGPVESRPRSDPYNAFVTTFLADAVIGGPLSDLELAVKDNVAVNGATITCGTDSFEWTPETDATVVERLRAAGAGLEGTTNMDPFAFGTTGEWSAHGRTENPAVEGHVPGGSSSGSAAAVAGDIVDAALGTDTAGSVRIPASFCGVVGFKPTFGVVPRTGVVDLSPSNDHVGVLADDVRTAARVFDVVAGQDATQPGTLPGPYRTNTTDGLDDRPDEVTVGVPEEFMAAADDAVEGEIERTLGALLRLEGVRVEDVSFPEREAAAWVNDVHTLMEFADVYRREGQPLGDGRQRGYREAMRRVKEAGFPVAERVRELVALGARLLDDEPALYGDAWETRRRIVHRQQALLGDVDVLAMPTTTMTAPPFDAVGEGSGPSVMDTYRNTAPFNLTGAPAVSLPCAETNGAPVGIQLVASPGADGFLLRVARLVEATLK